MSRKLAVSGSKKNHISVIGFLQLRAHSSQLNFFVYNENCALQKRVVYHRKPIPKRSTRKKFFQILNWFKLLCRWRRHWHHEMDKFLMTPYSSLIFELRSTQITGKFDSFIQVALSVLGEIFLGPEIYTAHFARSEWLLAGMNSQMVSEHT